MNNKPIKTLNMSTKRADGTYLKLGSNATWDLESYSWSINVSALRELLQLIDSGAIEPKNGYIGGKCGIFTNSEPAPKIATKQELPTSRLAGDEIPF